MITVLRVVELMAGFEHKKTRSPLIQRASGRGADGRIRTGDLILTKDALYRLSYISVLSFDNSGIIPQQFPKCKGNFTKKSTFLHTVFSM